MHSQLESLVTLTTFSADDTVYSYSDSHLLLVADTQGLSLECLCPKLEFSAGTNALRFDTKKMKSLSTHLTFACKINRIQSGRPTSAKG